MGVKVDITEVTSELYRYANFTRARCRKYLQQSCEMLEGYMKQNAPWNDRTGDARRGLSAKYVELYNQNDTVLTIELSHKVDYGVYLEYAMEQRFQILNPTIMVKAPEVLTDMRGILSRLGGS